LQNEGKGNNKGSDKAGICGTHPSRKNKNAARMGHGGFRRAKATARAKEEADSLRE
jgi:hypothetical protein